MHNLPDAPPRLALETDIFGNKLSGIIEIDDGFFSYRNPGRKFKKHIPIIGYEHGCGKDGSIDVNTVDNYMGILKRGITGV